MTAVKRRGTLTTAPPAGRVESTEWVGPTGRHLAPGVEFSAEGLKGRYVFVKHVRTEAGAEWVDAWGGKVGHERSHAIDPGRITVVHRVKRARGATE